MPRRTRSHVVVTVTAPDPDTARRLARGALEDRLAACVQILPGLESHYWWKGRLESASEVLLCFKTTPARVRPLEARVRQLHPYDTPEFLVLPVAAGLARYLDWMTAETRAPARGRKPAGGG
ncbi:MAG: divalent-cation tolerance protein CutA [Verrucomicrobiota bacterium]